MAFKVGKIWINDEALLGAFLGRAFSGVVELTIHGDITLVTVILCIGVGGYVGHCFGKRDK